MGPELDRGLSWAAEADIATAFVTPAAVKRVEAALRRTRSLKVRVIVGLYQRFTPPPALAKLLSLGREFPGRLRVRVARNWRFHWKHYAFRSGGARRFYVGSANLTQDGMTAEGELCLKITAAARDAISKSLESEFDTLWLDERKSVKLDNGLLKDYRKAARPPLTITKPDKDNVLRRILKPPERATSEPSPVVRAKPRVCFVPSYLLAETVEIVEAETNWDRRRWDFVLYPYKTDFDRASPGHVMLLVSAQDRAREYLLELISVVDKAMLDTPDGKYFVAYTRVPYSRAKRYYEVKSELNRAGLKWGDIKENVSLNRVQLEALCRILHVKPERLLARYSE